MIAPELGVIFSVNLASHCNLLAKSVLIDIRVWNW